MIGEIPRFPRCWVSIRCWFFVDMVSGAEGTSVMNQTRSAIKEEQ
jgi:hypothetical protein